MLILLSRALNNSMEEFAKIRGGDNKAFNYSNKIIHERGSVTLEEIRSLKSVPLSAPVVLAEKAIQ